MENSKEETNNPKKSTPINLLWTGGWDSTFRLLELLIIEKKSVQPYYIVDHERASTLYEMKAMQTIKEILFIKFPETQELLFPTITQRRNQIKPNKEITQKWKQFYKEIKLGSQYDWIPRFAEEQGLYDLELGHEKPYKPRPLDEIIDPNIIGEGHECRVTSNPTRPMVTLFKYFRFPIYFVTKAKMERISRENDFFDIMQNVWFCHRPRSNGTPCEFCRPCRVAKKSGFSHGLPPSNWLRDQYLKLCYKVSSAWDQCLHILKRISRKLKNFS